MAISKDIIRRCIRDKRDEIEAAVISREKENGKDIDNSCSDL